MNCKEGERNLYVILSLGEGSMDSSTSRYALRSEWQEGWHCPLCHPEWNEGSTWL